MLSFSTALGGEQDAIESWDPDKPMVVTGRPLRVKPILMHSNQSPRDKISWRSWSTIINEPAAAEEFDQIGRELADLKKRAGFPLEILPPVKVTSVEQAAAARNDEFDVVLLFAASGGKTLFHACCAQRPEQDAIVFLRHRSGPVYYWYEAFGTRVAKVRTPENFKTNSARNHGGLTVDDAVVDDYDDVLWRLRALYGLNNFIGQRVVALGGAGGKYDSKAADVAKEKYLFDIIPVGYDELTSRLKTARQDDRVMRLTQQWTERFLAMPHTTLETKMDFVRNAFILYVIFKDWLSEHRAAAITVKSCMNTIIPISETTACMTLGWLNDEGYLAFCESDFVIIPPGVMLHYISGKPVFMHNSTFPHKGIVTCAHCAAPRRMDGRRYEPMRVLTHYESDFGAAPKVELPVGQRVTFVDPEYSSGRWLGMTGVVRDNPFMPICRSQQDVEIEGDWRKLKNEARDSHWMMAYGDHLRELGYASWKLGVRWEELSHNIDRNNYS